MIANLSMYARPENRSAYNSLWTRVRENLTDVGIDAPAALDETIAHDAVWARDDLILAQICNLPYRAWFKDKVTLVGAADYGIEDTAPGYYRSYFVVRSDDPAKRIEDCASHRFALNDPLSQSGWGSPFEYAQSKGIRLNAMRITGSHRASLAAVADGFADLASIDANCWRMDKSLPAAAALRILDRTHETPSLTFVTCHPNPQAIFAAVQQAIADMSANDRVITGLRGIHALPVSAYHLPNPPKLNALTLHTA